MSRGFFALIFFVVAISHALILFYKTDRKEKVTVKKEVQTPTLQVSMIKEIKPKPKVEPRKKIIKKKKISKRKKIVKKKKTKPIKKEEIIEPVQEIIKKEVKPVQTPPQPKIDTKKLDRIKANYLAGLRAEILKYKKYPKMAKRMKQEGKTIVKFTVHKNGKITNIEILSAAKYKSLNSAAIKTIQKLGKFDPIPKELNKNSWTIKIPIEFKII